MSLINLPLTTAIRRKIRVREEIENLNTRTTIIKDFNSTEFYDDSKDGKLTIRQTLNYNVNTFKSLLPQVPIPMDVDTNDDNKNESDTFNAKINHYFTEKRENCSSRSKSNLKRRRKKKISENSDVKSNKVHYGGVIKILAIVLFLIVGVSLYLETVDKVLDIDKLKLELEASVLNQSNAITTIINNFERKHLWLERSKILPLVGGTGVGKTLTVNIIKKFFIPELVHEINGNQLTNINKQQAIISHLNSCCCNLIVIDDLNSMDIEHFFNFIEKLPVQNQNLVIIPILNIQNEPAQINTEIDTNYFQFIKKSFEESGLFYELVLFDSLNLEVVKQWIKDELLKRNISEEKHNYVIGSLIDEHYVKYQGFKGISAKLALVIDDL